MCVKPNFFSYFLSVRSVPVSPDVTYHQNSVCGCVIVWVCGCVVVWLCGLGCGCCGCVCGGVQGVCVGVLECG